MLRRWRASATIVTMTAGSQDRASELDLGYGWDAPRIDGARIAMARKALGLSTAELAAEIGTSSTSVSNWESGRKQPTLTLERLCEALSVTPSFLAPLPLNATEAGPFFRSQRRPEKVRAEALAYAHMVGELADYFERRVGLPAPAIPEGIRTGPAEAAREVRRQVGLGAAPITNMVRLAEQLGCIVCFAKPLRVSIDAFSLKAAKWPIIVLTPKGDYYRQRWDVAHELGHLVMHGDDPPSRPIEREADAFAAELLLPGSELVNRLPISISNNRLAEFFALKEEWGASLASLLRRAMELGVMHEATFLYAQEVRSRRGWTKREPGKMQRPEMTTTLPDAVAAYVSRGVTLEELLEEIGMSPEILRAAIARNPIASIDL